MNHLDLSGVQKHVEQEGVSLSDMLQLHHEVFQKGMRTLCGTTTKIHIKEGAQPKFMKARSMPFAMQAKIENESEHMQSENRLEAV